MRVPDSVHVLARDLREVFGARFRSLVVYRPVAGGRHTLTPTLALVDDLTVVDLEVCAVRVSAWREAALAPPLLIPAREFQRSLDTFPFEFGAILADHAVIVGPSPFDGLHVDEADLRSASERQLRSHLLHLREGYLETGGRGSAIADLLAASAAPLAGIVESVARLRRSPAESPAAAARDIEQLVGAPDGALQRVMALADGRAAGTDDARRMFPAYLDALERLTQYVDRWRPE